MAGPGPVAPQFAQGYIASHSSLFKVDSLAQLEELVSRRRKVEGSIPWDFFLFFRLIAWMVAVVGGTGCP